ncbi:MAG TPA: M20 family metallopeptidase [Chloroflexota bacterium]|jgi:acetylornithine deacetylase/succinyl-diaminopimelate desuccinylase-like protein
MTTTLGAALAYLDTRRDQLIEFLRGLIATPSITIEMGERAIADVVIEHTRALGLAEPEVVYARPEHPNLLYRLAGAAAGPTLILNAHLDTQPVGDGAAWSHDPFGGHIEGNRLYGLGSSDMKGAVAAMVYALAALAKAAAPCRGTLLLALVANEEDGGTYGADWLVREYGLTGDACVVGEPSGVHHEWEAIYNAQRGQSAVWVRANGQQMHSGVAHAFGAVNAAVHMARVIEALDNELVIVPAADPTGARAQATLGVLVRCGDAWGINPGVAEFGVDVRTVPGMVRLDVARGFDEALARVRRNHPGIAVSWRFHDAPWDWIAPTHVAPESAVMRAAAAAATTILGAAPPLGLYPATTDASAFATVAGIPTIAALGPGCIGRAHRADEYVSPSSVIDAAKLYVTLVLRYLEVG